MWLVDEKLLETFEVPKDKLIFHSPYTRKFDSEQEARQHLIDHCVKKIDDMRLVIQEQACILHKQEEMVWWCDFTNHMVVHARVVARGHDYSEINVLGKSIVVQNYLLFRNKEHALDTLERAGMPL